MDHLQIIIPAIMAVVALITLAMTITSKITAGFKEEREERAKASKALLEGQAAIRTDVKTTIDALSHRVEKIEDKAADFRSGKAIDEGMLHLKGNVLQVYQGLAENHSRTSMIVDGLKDRVTRLETQHEQTSKVVTEIKTEQKEMRQEINERFDNIAKLIRENRP